MSTIECIVRAVIEEHGKFLLCRKSVYVQDANQLVRNWFFPGGHIEEGESATEALVREIREELGEESAVVRFLGTSENRFEKNGDTHEINLVFEVRLLKDGAKISQEDHLEFAWFTREEMREMTVLPLSLRDAVLASMNKPFWASEGFKVQCFS